MIVDTSALYAILRGEPEADEFAEAIATARHCRLSAGGWIELGAVLARRGDAHLIASLRNLMREAAIEIAPVDAEQAELGHQAYFAFGKGRHRASLNFGDCFAYALAKSTGEPLLFKGNDFKHTDVTAAL